MSLSSMGSSSGSSPGVSSFQACSGSVTPRADRTQARREGMPARSSWARPSGEGWAIFHCLYRMAGHLLPLMWDQQVYYGSIKRYYSIVW